ncbi:uncharacterized protein [Haliotis cracherodii]|uniref:uncharacterized protein n=1 Tax=Haliotis cracherodii TaxID=6455 RepID=UPI0039ECE66B
MGPWFVVVIILMAWLTDACDLPDFMQTQNSTQAWYSHVRHDRPGSRVIAVQGGTISIRDTFRATEDHWNCTVALKDKYVVQKDQGSNQMLFSCVKFYRRSKSIVQVAWSQSGKLDPEHLCSETSLTPDPWLLVAFNVLESDFSPCSVSGGFNMKIEDSYGKRNPCNLMDLPMRLESDCLAGEGVTFNFRSQNCLPLVSMRIVQETLCVASWSSRRSHFSVLRKHNVDNVWCLRIPRREHHTMHAILFTDAACVETDDHEMETVTYLNLFLERVVYNNLCADEYPECADMPCNSYTRRQCMKTCRACDPRRPAAICSYPRNYRGLFTLVDRDGTKAVEITESMMTIQHVGTFQCMVFSGSPSASKHIYSTVSVTQNGCRPRYNCVKLKKLGPSVLAYSLSQSLVWPIVDAQLSASACDKRKFTADLDPISDLYRSHFDTKKPIVAEYPRPLSVACNLTSAYTIQATFQDGHICPGSMYEDCKEHSRLRMDFTECLSAPLINEYKCIAVFEGQYWEKIVLIQNTIDESDARCIVFNHLKKLEALIMRAGECDKLSWRFAKNDVRKALVTLQIRQDMFPCKNLPSVDRTTSARKGQLSNDNVSTLVTVDPTPGPPTPSRPRSDDSYQHVDSVHSAANSMYGVSSCVIMVSIVYSGL